MLFLCADASFLAPLAVIYERKSRIELERGKRFRFVPVPPHAGADLRYPVPADLHRRAVPPRIDARREGGADAHQAGNIGLPLLEVSVPDMPGMAVYENAMRTAWSGLKERGAAVSVFGDIFLEDLRRYREDQLARWQVKSAFPLWNGPTDALVRELIDLGFKAVTTCVNGKYLDKSFAGRILDRDFLKDLPAGVDPCGENGEFHTFVFDGPLFKSPVPFTVGETVYRQYAPGRDGAFDTGFWFTDLLPGDPVSGGV